MGEYIAAQALDDLPTHPARIVVGDVVTDAAQSEQHHHADRYLPQDRGVLIDECTAHERLHQVRQCPLRGGEQNHAEYADQEYADVRPRVAQKAPIYRPGAIIGFRKTHARGRDCAQGEPPS